MKKNQVENQAPSNPNPRRNLSVRNIPTRFGNVTPMEYGMFRKLQKVGTFSRLQMLSMGIPIGVIRNLIKCGMVESVTLPTKIHFKIADGIIED